MPDKITVRRSEIRTLVDAIRALDAKVEEWVKDGDGKLTARTRSYDLSGSAIYALGRTLKFVEPELDVFNETIRKRRADSGSVSQAIAVVIYDAAKAGKSIEEAVAMANTHEETRKKMAAIEAELFAFVTEPVEIQVHRAKIAELKVETNKIPGSVLAGLLPMIDGEL